MSPCYPQNNLLRRLWSTAKGHRLILENFLSLGLINVLNSSFHLIIYPILIRRVGAEAYGTYVYAFSIVAYFTTLVTYGLDMIGTRYLAISDRDNDTDGKSDITSRLISSKLYLALIAILIFIPIVLCMESLSPYKPLLWANFLVVVAYVFMPGWYYIGIQSTRVYLYIQIVTKVLLALAIIIWVLDATDITLYALFVSVNSIVFSTISLAYILRKQRVSLRIKSPRECLTLLRESTPLFLSNLVITVKSAGLNLVIGNMFGMTTLTGYDFSMRVVNTVTSLTKQLNTALFPSVSANFTQERARKLLRMEVFVGLAFMLALILLAKPIIWIMGNGPIESMIMPIFILLSALIPIWLVSGFYIELVLTAHGKNKEVFYNQLISLGVIIIGVAVAYILQVNVFSFAAIVVLSGLIEIVILNYMSKRTKIFVL